MGTNQPQFRAGGSRSRRISTHRLPAVLRRRGVLLGCVITAAVGIALIPIASASTVRFYPEGDKLSINTGTGMSVEVGSATIQCPFIESGGQIPFGPPVAPATSTMEISHPVAKAECSTTGLSGATAKFNNIGHTWKLNGIAEGSASFTIFPESLLLELSGTGIKCNILGDWTGAGSKPADIVGTWHNAAKAGETSTLTFAGASLPTTVAGSSCPSAVKGATSLKVSGIFSMHDATHPESSIQLH